MLLLKVFILAVVISDSWARPRPITVFDESAKQIFEAPAVRSSNQFMIAHKSVPINYFPKSYDNSPLNKPVGTGDGMESTNEAESNTLQRQRCYEEDEESAESQVTTDTKTQVARDGKECYFKHERLNPDGLEKNERPKVSKVSNKCDNKLRSFEELADSESLPELFGAENNADLALIRGAAEFGYDFDDEAVKERMKNIFICETHEKELVFRWKSWKTPRHVLYKQSRSESKAACTVPNELLDQHGSDSTSVLAKPGRYLRKKQAEAFLRETGTHLQVGIPMCQAHAEHIDRWQINNAVEKDGLQVVPDVDYAGAASVEQARSVYSEQSSVQSAYCSPKSSGSSRDSMGHQTPEH
uniref:Uncharacterized protein n=1 Tax=Plectus sambesii TaxID=2011161 RepID=A0A914UXF5_9BILA